ncbi:hypothetical protein WAI453_008279 [Rhynchosporium graminicola]
MSVTLEPLFGGDDQIVLALLRRHLPRKSIISSPPEQLKLTPSPRPCLGQVNPEILGHYGQSRAAHWFQNTDDPCANSTISHQKHIDRAPTSANSVPSWLPFGIFLFRRQG